MPTLLQDLKFGIRLLAKTPGFTTIAALSLALGIGANATIFTLINAVLLNPLPVEEPSPLEAVWTTDDRNTGGFHSFLQISALNSRDLRDKHAVFSGAAAHPGLASNLSRAACHAHLFNVVGRLKPGVTIEQAAANLRTIAAQLEKEDPNDNRGRSVTMLPIAQSTRNPAFRNIIVSAGELLMTIVALVLLIACA